MCIWPKNSRHTSRAIVFGVVAVLLTSCSMHSEQVKGSSSNAHDRGLDTSQLSFGKLTEVPKTQAGQPCSWIPAATAGEMYTSDHRVLGKVWRDADVATLRCTWEQTLPSVDALAEFTVKEHQRPKPLNYMVEAHYVYAFDESPEAPFVDFSRKYPGAGFVRSPKEAWWTCGNIEVRYHNYDYDPDREQGNLKRSLWLDNMQAFEAAIKSLCGTLDSPSEHVRQWPQIVWDRFDAFGGASPEEYGVTRPPTDSRATYPGP